MRTGRPYNQAGGALSYARPYSHRFQVLPVDGYDGIEPDVYYDLAAYWAKKLIDGDYGIYELTDYGSLWTKSHRYDSEFLFCIYTPSADTKYKTSIHTNYEGIFTDASCEFIADGAWIGCTYNCFDTPALKETERLALASLHSMMRRNFHM